MRAVFAGMVLFAFASVRANACSGLTFQPDEMLTNEPVYSANGRYCVIERWYEGVEDFKSERAGTLLRLDAPEPESETPREPRKTMTYAMYESSSRTRLAELSLPFDDRGDTLVTDSGRYIAIVHPLRYGCSGYTQPDDALVTIFQSDGTRVGRLTVADVLTPSDVALSTFEYQFAFTYALRHESDTREVLVLSLDGHERRIDLDSATLLDRKENILPAPAVLADAAPRTRDYGAAPFDDAQAIHLDSKDLLDRAISEPLPQFPLIAQKARLNGTVWVQVVVSEYGEVAALRSTSLPFGLQDAANASLKEWRFRPLSVDGKRVKFTGEVAVHFVRAVPP